MSIYTFKPTYLYIKQHTITGKLYFGKTDRPYPFIEKYTGSGTYWRRHIKKHGKKHIVNLWYCLFYNEDDCKEFAEMFSINNNIVESTEWANQVMETGITYGGIRNYKMTLEQRQHLSKINLGNSAGKGNKGVKKKPRTPEHCKNLSNVLKGRKNPPRSEETKRKISESMKRYKSTCNQQ